MPSILSNSFKVLCILLLTISLVSVVTILVVEMQHYQHRYDVTDKRIVDFRPGQAVIYVPKSKANLEPNEVYYDDMDMAELIDPEFQFFLTITPMEYHGGDMSPRKILCTSDYLDHWNYVREGSFVFEKRKMNKIVTRIQCSDIWFAGQMSRLKPITNVE